MQRGIRRAAAHRRKGIQRSERVAVERLAQQSLDGVGQIPVVEALARALDFDEVRRELDGIRADRAHGCAQETRFVARGATKHDAGVLGPGLRQDLERRRCDGQELSVCAAVRAFAGDGFSLREALVFVYINRHGRAFLLSVPAWRAARAPPDRLDPKRRIAPRETMAYSWPANPREESTWARNSVPGSSPPGRSWRVPRFWPITRWRITRARRSSSRASSRKSDGRTPTSASRCGRSVATAPQRSGGSR